MCVKITSVQLEFPLCIATAYENLMAFVCCKAGPLSNAMPQELISVLTA